MNVESQTLSRKLIQILYTLLLAVAGGFIFYLLHIPLPWMLGALTVILLTSQFTKLPLYWPTGIRNIGLIMIGYMLGTSLNKKTILQILSQLPSMLIVTILILLFAGCFAYFVTKITGIPFRSTLTGSIPGGLSQMVILGEEIKDVDLTVVTFFQVIRLFSVIFIVPVLVLSPILGKGNAGSTEAVEQAISTMHWHWWLVLIFAVATTAAAMIGKKIKLPTAYLLGPILATAIFGLLGCPTPDLPGSVIDLSQVLMGAYLGLMIKPAELDNKLKISGFAVITGMVMVCFSFLIAFVLRAALQIPTVTAFLGVAPGGMAELGVVAKKAQVTLSIVTGYQMFRIFFILFFVPPVLKWLFNCAWFQRLERHATVHHERRKDATM